MSFRICTPSGSHIYGNRDLGIELDDDGLCEIQSTERSHMHPYKSSQNTVKAGLVGDALTMTDLSYTPVCHFGGTAPAWTSRTR
jgi:hypothetical protein